MSNQTPYIGSKISLISKLDIRYEGILYTVDTNDSTIALAKVRSFGTEDRPTPNPVEARDDVYEYIIFKANDIKDLIVCETPKVATLAGGLPYDPAIISVSARTGSATANEQQASAGSSRSDTPHHRASPNLAQGNRAPGAGRNSAGRGNRGNFAQPGGLKLTRFYYYIGRMNVVLVLSISMSWREKIALWSFVLVLNSCHL
ncbi:hypothetical protein ANCCAN_26084 [Ancylostoma caninum]|uniref:Sm domain-containing protein n=1 Tax=Ancylostoma caninum TaxID=29170 RepID=A0A368FDA5_ANCCA|nr:hypothetical protein ANCCAN_26084 [Ancylostoma caninum]